MSNRILTVLEIVQAGLIANGYDGLCNPDEGCECEVCDLAPCGEIRVDCTAGWKAPCDCGDCDFHISSDASKIAWNMARLQKEEER